MKFAVKYLKNMIYPLNVPESIHLTDGQMVLVRTDKGEEAELYPKEICRLLMI